MRITLLIYFFIISAVFPSIKPENNSTVNYIHILFEWEQESENDFYILDVSEDSNDIDGNCIICDQYISGSLILSNPILSKKPLIPAKIIAI